MLALAFGTLFLDLVDKPLAWTVNVLPSSRSFSPLVVTMTAVVAVAYVALDGRPTRSNVAPFGLGDGSHLLGDSVGPVLVEDGEGVAFLGRPLASTDYGVETGFLAHFARVDRSDLLGPEEAS